MNKYLTKTIGLILIILFTSLFIKFLTNDKSNTQPEEVGGVVVEGLQYKNNLYGFGIDLPETWRGYSVVEDQWEGYSLVVQSAEGQVVTEVGPMLFVRHPKWEEENPRQDIPVMIFTITQWNNLSADKFHIGAAPVGPTELGRNSRYVFALPARYNYSFLTGYEEVQDILDKKSFKTF
jgi:hypothetical protein